MATNFEHMKQWNNIYEKLVYTERRLMEADEKNEDMTKRNALSGEDRIMLTGIYDEAIFALRVPLELMVKELVRAAGISNEEILAIMKAAGKDDGHVNLYSMIMALEKKGIISASTADNMHFIRKNGNQNGHGGNVSQASRVAMDMYEKICRESYLFARQYMPALSESKKGAGNRTSSNVREKNGSASGWIWAAVIVAAVLMFLFFL